MLSTWLFIIILGGSAQAIETENMQECLELRKFVEEQIGKSETLKGKAATGCFKNMGERSHDS